MDKLEYVLMLAEERNLTRAAARLFISQPTLTNYINRLEKELGVKLFDRNVQPIQVTEAGLVYIEDMKKIQKRELALRAKLQTLSRKNKTFQIGIPPVRSAHDLPCAIQEFSKKYPDITINIDNRLEEELEKALEVGSIDVAIGALITAYPGVHYECIKEDKTYLLVPRSYECVSHLSANEATIENPYLLDSSVLSEKCLLLPRAGGGNHRMAMLMTERYGIVPKTIINCSNLNTLYQLAGKGVGYLFTTPRPFMEEYQWVTNQVAFCVLQKEELIQKSYVAYLEEKQNSQMIQDFIKILKMTLK